MSERPIRAAILGATGYGAGELLRLLVGHPLVDVVGVSSTSMAGAPIAAAHPHLAGFFEGSAFAPGVDSRLRGNDALSARDAHPASDALSASDARAGRAAFARDARPLRIEAAIDWARLRDAEHAILFSALPHDASPAAISAALQAAQAAGVAVRVIDLSGALRLRDAASHQRHYPETPLAADLRTAFTYGMPELDRAAVRAARHISNPGCLATAATLAIAPLVADGFAGNVAIDARTGSSGSGKGLKETTHHPTRHADFRAYKPLAHQHEPEILQALGDARGARVALSFVAHSLPVSRGIFVTAHLTFDREQSAAALRESYARFYADSPFVRVRADSPTLQDVVGSNFCDVAVFARGRQVVALAAIDNLVKGMAGAAIQNMNLICGYDERLGLWAPALRPV